MRLYLKIKYFCNVNIVKKTKKHLYILFFYGTVPLNYLPVHVLLHKNDLQTLFVREMPGLIFSLTHFPLLNAEKNWHSQ